jgi:hypothetical protein
MRGGGSGSRGAAPERTSDPEGTEEEAAEATEEGVAEVKELELGKAQARISRGSRSRLTSHEFIAQDFKSDSHF